MKKLVKSTMTTIYDQRSLFKNLDAQWVLTTVAYIVSDHTIQLVPGAHNELPDNRYKEIVKLVKHKLVDEEYLFEWLDLVKLAQISYECCFTELQQQCYVAQLYLYYVWLRDQKNTNGVHLP
jgi:hypothetical protein